MPVPTSPPRPAISDTDLEQSFLSRCRRLRRRHSPRACAPHGRLRRPRPHRHRQRPRRRRHNLARPPSRSPCPSLWPPELHPLHVHSRACIHVYIGGVVQTNCSTRGCADAVAQRPLHSGLWTVQLSAPSQTQSSCVLACSEGLAVRPSPMRAQHGRRPPAPNVCVLDVVILCV